MPDPQLLTRGKVEAQAISGGGGTYDFDINVVGDSTLVVNVDMTGAAAQDLDVTVYPFEADYSTVGGAGLQAKQFSGPRLTGGHVYVWGSYDVQAIERVRIRITNNNAGAQTITRANWRLQ